MSELGNEVVVEEKGKKKRVSTEDKLQMLLDKQFERIEQLMDEKLNKLLLKMDSKLEYSQLRIWKSFEAEFKRYLAGYCNENCQ
ncbi:hypothetical protein [Desulfosporosinus youngiae]|uniref:Uncharacterized protein n=1 Tax=Desulfosporosinus youngiae DSM 17734 TaxID=768710 RepID=H5Y579_9FIRM|nr:hypothetical protein [Desulfosporosinus youngiae]EHQ90183.1 hypothetical protein DesyoDRAFT_3149 [Desulfosporosinus youngiae DSM 17734]